MGGMILPDVTFAAGASSSPRALFTVIDAMTGGATVVAATPTLVRLTQVGPGGILFQYDVTGAGFTFGLVGGSPVITGGTIAGLTVTQAGALQMTVTGLGLGAVAFQTALTQENSGANTAAIENLFLPLGWSYHGNANADVLLATDVSLDGVALNLTGNDSFDGGGGNDNLFLGDGDDLAHGATGNDSLNGGDGLDKLFGDSGNDQLNGGNQNDRLSGGSGTDILLGGAGKDAIDGGTGSDLMTGNSGPDRFIFSVGDGIDTITDFNLSNDKIDLQPGVVFSFAAVGVNDSVLIYGPGGVDSILLLGVSFANVGLVNII